MTPNGIWVPSQYKDHLSRYIYFHYKDKTVVRPFYLYNGNSYTGKSASLYWDGPPGILVTSVLLKGNVTFSMPNNKLNQCCLFIEYETLEENNQWWLNQKTKIFYQENIFQKFCQASSVFKDVNGPVQERCNSIANTLELDLSCTNPLIWHI